MNTQNTNATQTANGARVIAGALARMNRNTDTKNVGVAALQNHSQNTRGKSSLPCFGQWGDWDNGHCDN